MGAQLEVGPARNTEGEHLLLWLLLAATVVGALLGGSCVWLCLQSAPRDCSPKGPQPKGWAGVVLKALKFI